MLTDNFVMLGKDKGLVLLRIMRVEEYILNDLKPLSLDASAGEALELLAEMKHSHWPVRDGEQYRGLIAEDDLLDLDQPDQPLAAHQNLLRPYFLSVDDHLYQAIAKLSKGNLSLLPVLNEEGLYLGYLSAWELTWNLGRQISYAEPGSLLVLRVAVRDYHLSQIAQIVESEDARITGLQLRADGPEHLRLALKINQVDLSRIVKSLERFEYQIVELYHESLFDDSAADRYGSLMKYLNI